MKEKKIDITEKWISDFVVGWQICPFAQKVVQQKQILYILSEAREEKKLMEDLLQAIQQLLGSSSDEWDTLVLIHPDVLHDFQDYWAFVGEAEELLKKANLNGVIQLATFHPQYQFSGTDEDSPENYTNRSPYQMIHVLREDSLSKALENYPDPENIPNRNIEKLRREGIEKMEMMWRSYAENGEE